MVGSKNFLGIAAERSDLYAYLLGPPTQPDGSASTVAAATHLVAWRPVAAGDGPDEPTIQTSLDLPRTPVKVKCSGEGG
jgi:hypothetical protein